MRIVASRADLRRAISGMPRPVALVPTMGALHAGHGTLLDLARRHAPTVVASVFVNPMQFSDADDLATYPRTPEEDDALCAAHLVDLVWRPGRADVFASEDPEPVPPSLADELEGRDRPGHFVGVATVVRELWSAASPDLAVFGEKDYQQLVVLRALAARRGGPAIVAGATHRDPDGLASSSRNARLSPEARRVALALPRALGHALERWRRGERGAGEICAGVATEMRGAATSAVPVEVHYAAIRDAESLAEVRDARSGTRLLVAATVAGVRLIDNVPLA